MCPLFILGFIILFGFVLILTIKLLFDLFVFNNINFHNFNSFLYTDPSA